jgi:hypothetical protein
VATEATFRLLQIASREERPLSWTDFELSPWLVLVIGLLLAFAGRALVLFQFALLGALVGAAAASTLLTGVLISGWVPPPDWPLEWLRIGAMIVGALVGWALAGLARRLALFVLGAAAGAAALPQIAAPWADSLPAGLLWLVGAFLGGVLLLALEGPLLKLGTAILGGLLVASALAVILAPEDAGLVPLMGLGVATLGAVVQLARR